MSTRVVAGRIAVIAVVLGTIGCDRMTKHVASTTLAEASPQTYLADTVWLGYVENTGGFMGLGANWSPGLRTAVFTGSTGLMLLALIVLGIRHRSDRWLVLGLSLFVAGGASNWIDRLLRGSVVDFLTVGIGPVRTGVFNVADVAIMAGAGIIVLYEIRRSAKPPSHRRTIDPVG
jgi:signal peptidase II